jgi:hypothetical protein
MATEIAEDMHHHIVCGLYPRKKAVSAYEWWYWSNY